MLRFGHPVATLDLVIEAGVHNHARVRGPTCKNIYRSKDEQRLIEDAFSYLKKYSEIGITGN